MSGHSKWAKVKYQKAAKDPKKSKAFSKLANLITVAAHEGGDIESNPKLRLAVEKAKDIGMTKDSIEKAIQRGQGKTTEAAKLEEIYYEAYTPGGGALLIQVITDNKNRTSNEIRHLLGFYGAKLASSGSVRYLFKEVIKINIPLAHWQKKYSLEAIEKGILDIEETKDAVILSISPQQFNFFKDWLNKELNIPYQIETDFLPQQKIEIKEDTIKKQVQDLFDALDENSDVEEFYSNINFPAN